MTGWNRRTTQFLAAGCILAGWTACGSNSSTPSEPASTPLDASTNTADSAAASGSLDATADAKNLGDAVAAPHDGGAVVDAAVIEGGIAVCAGNTSQTCATCTNCAQCAGCEMRVPPASCTGTPSFTDCSQCDNSCTGCFGCSIQTGCVYADSGINTCAQYAASHPAGYCEEAFECTAQDDGGCGGTIAPCSTFNDLSNGECSAASWHCAAAVTGCGGPLPTCDSQLNATDCAKENGCTWTTPTQAVCTGTLAPCEAYDAGVCASVPGCGVVQADPHPQCNSASAGCFSCGSSVCAGPLACCGSTLADQTCGPFTACGTDSFQTTCDGPEDCPGAQCCASIEIPEANSTMPPTQASTQCAAACPVDNASVNNGYLAEATTCRSGADCANVFDEFQVPFTSCCKAAGYPVGVCVSQTFSYSFISAGGTCN